MKKYDVVRITNGQCKGQTGVFLRNNGDSVCIVLKSNRYGFGTWFQFDEVKRIGNVARFYEKG